MKNNYENELNLKFEEYTKSEDFLKAIDIVNELIKISESPINHIKNRGFLLERIGNYNEAVTDLEIANINIPNDGATLQNLGNCYLQTLKWQKAIDVFTQLEKLEPENYYILSTRGAAYLHSGYYQLAINDFKKYMLQSDEQNSIMIHNLNIGIAYNYLEKHNESIEYTSKYIDYFSNDESGYLQRSYSYGKLENEFKSNCDLTSYIHCSILNNKPLKLNYITDSYRINNPSNYLFIFQSLNLEPKVSNHSKIINSHSDLYFLNLILQHIKEFNKLNEKDFLSISAIVEFYSGGQIPSNFKFIEIINKNKYDFKDLYYLCKSSFHIKTLFLKHFSFFRNYLKNEKKLTIIDCYYIGQTELLYGNIEGAISFFNPSIDFYYSRVMLLFLIEKEENINFFNENNIAIEDLSVINLKTNLENYFYREECSNALQYINSENIINYKLPQNDKPIHNYFNFKKIDFEIIKVNLNKFRIEKIINNIEIIFTNSIDKIQPNNGERISLLEKNFLLIQNKNIKDLFVELENVNKINTVGIDNEVENNIAKLIIENKISNPKIYLYFIEYYFLTNKISKFQSFDLFMFLITKNENIEYINQNILSKSIEIFGSFIINPLFSFSYNVLKNLIPILNEVGKNDTINLNDNFEYFEFKENLWKIINYDFQTMSKDNFEKKYYIFNWFGDY